MYNLFSLRHLAILVLVLLAPMSGCHKLSTEQTNKGTDGQAKSNKFSYPHPDTTMSAHMEYDDETTRVEDYPARLKLTLPLVGGYDSTYLGDIEPLPWFWSLSSQGERIMLVDRLNRQVLRTDKQFINAYAHRHTNITKVIADANSIITNSIVENMNTINAAVPDLTAKQRFDAASGLALSSEASEKLLDSLIEGMGSIGETNQRITFFNLRPAIVAAAERSPSVVAVGERQILDRLDLTTLAISATAVFEPLTIALGVVDSIAKRIIKKDGDTEFTYISTPAPLFSRPGRQDAGANNLVAAYGNRVTLGVSNNGKYELHINPTPVTVQKDSPIGWEHIDRWTGAASAAIVASMASAFIAQEEALRDTRIALGQASNKLANISAQMRGLVDSPISYKIAEDNPALIVLSFTPSKVGLNDKSVKTISYMVTYAGASVNPVEGAPGTFQLKIQPTVQPLQIWATVTLIEADDAGIQKLYFTKQAELQTVSTKHFQMSYKEGDIELQKTISPELSEPIELSTGTTKVSLSVQLVGDGLSENYKKAFTKTQKTFSEPVMVGIEALALGEDGSATLDNLTSGTQKTVTNLKVYPTRTEGEKGPALQLQPESITFKVGN